MQGVWEAALMVLVWYRGYRVLVTSDAFRVFAPNGDTARFEAMSSVRAWVRRHAKSHVGA